MSDELTEQVGPLIDPVAPEEIPDDFTAGNGQWLVHRATITLGDGHVAYAIVHADDGVMWGVVAEGQIRFPPRGEWTPEFRARTIQQCRVFGDEGELFIWREDEGRWRGRVVAEVGEADYERIEETHFLLGNRVHASQSAPEGFTAVVDVSTGMRQIVPITVTPDDFEKGNRVKLTVCNYLERDSDGAARIFCSRLKSIGLKPI